MKRIWCFAIIFTFVLGLHGCKKYETSGIKLYNRNLNATFELTDEQEKDFLELWNEGKWKNGVLDRYFGYEFVLDDGSVIQCSIINDGLFYDKKEERILNLTAKQRDFVRTIIGEQVETNFELQEAQIYSYVKKRTVVVAAEDMRDVLAILSHSDWEYDYSDKKYYNYRFNLEDTSYSILYQTEDGVFSYSDYQFTATEEQRQQINAFLKQQFAR